MWDETQDAEAEEARPAPEAAAIEPEPAQSLEPPESLAEAREENPQEPEAGDAGPSPEAAVIEPEPAKSSEPPESFAEAQAQNAEEPGPEKAGPSPEAQAVKPQSTKGSEPMQKPERERTNDIEPEEDQEAKARTKEELVRWLEALPRGSAFSPENGNAAMPSSEKLEMELGAPPRGHTPSNGPRPSEPQDWPAGRQMSGSATVLELLPGEHHNRQPWALYGLSAAAALGISLLIFSVWLFCIPFLGVKCKSGGDFDAAVSCARGGSLEACGIGLARKSEEESARSREAASRERAKAEAAMREMLRREAEERQAAEAATQEWAKTEATAREKARREAGERQAAEAAAQEQAKTEAAAQERARREAGERQAAEAAAQERANAEAAALEKSRRETEALQAAEAAARERAKVEAAARDNARLEAAREKSRLEAQERDRVEKETREKAAQAVQATASASLYVQPATTLAVPEGNYSGRTIREESCSPAAESIIVTVKGGKICWEHDLSVPNQWAGTIDPAGAVAARVRDRPGTSAAGQVVNGGAMSIEMTYPGCANPIRIKLLGLIGSASACP